MSVKMPRGSAAKRAGAGYVQEKFSIMRQDMNKGLVEREAEIDLVLTALLCKEHPLLVGPPGTAKSMLLDGLASFMQDEDSKFDYLMTKFTDPGEIFGPVDVIALTKERATRRVIEGYAADVALLFFDEIFKASSAILNTTLKLLNERKFKCGKQKIDCPLQICVAASNEWPNDENGGKELGALFDRFLFRKEVKPVSKASRKRLLWEEHGVKPSTTITPKELELAHLEMKKFDWSDEAQQAVEEILDQLNAEGIFPGDRRQVKCLDAVQAYAYLNGAEGTVEKEHLEILQHVLWDDPTEQPAKCAKIVNKIANPIGMLITEKLAQAQDVINSIDYSQKHNVYDAVAKLEHIRDELMALPKSPRCDTALEYVCGEIKRHYSKVVKGSL